MPKRPGFPGFVRKKDVMNRTVLAACRVSMVAVLGAALVANAPAHAQQPQRPNILVIMGDDVGTWNVSAYHRGMMGGRTPNIDRIAREGALLTDYYAQQSCTAGRAAFILGQTPFRTGLLKVGLPAAKQGVQDKDPTIAQLLKPLGYATGQIGKNQTFKNHLDGYNLLPYFKGEIAKSPRHEFFYFTDGGDLNAVRYNDWKVSFKTVAGNLFTGHEATTNAPLVTNLRQDPWERYQSDSMSYGRWWGEKMWTFLPATTIVGRFLETFKEYPPSAPPSNFGVDHALKALEQGYRGAGK
jgi:hypothetical protein